MIDKQGVLALAHALKRVMELTAENYKLKQEVKSRRHQSDVWRTKCKRLEVLAKATQR